MVATTQLTHPGSARSRGMPALIDRYEVRRVIGRGGMGVVYEAWDPRVRCAVAVKVLDASNEMPQAEVRLLREARAMASLAHPNVVSVRDVGTCDGDLFIVMPLIRGVTLRQWAEAGVRTLDDTLHTLIAAGRGLAAINAAGIVHRDFKPDNVLVDETGQVRVADFGIARRIETREGEVDTRLTQTGSLIGTPAYMAPEQAHGVALTAAADQFSFCVTAWELLARQLPFTGPTAMAVLTNLVTGNITPAAAEQRWPRALRRALRRGLSTAPAARYATLEDLLAELEAVRRGLGVASEPTRPTQAAVPRKRRWWIAGAMLAAFAASGLIVMAVAPPRTVTAAPVQAPALSLDAHEPAGIRTHGVAREAAPVAPERVPRSAPPIAAPTARAAEVISTSAASPEDDVIAKAPEAPTLREKYKEVLQLAWDRGFLPDDIPGFRAIDEQADAAIEANDAPALERLLVPQSTNILAVKVDQAFIEQKIARLRVTLKVEMHSPETAANIERYFAKARRIATVEQDPARANRLLSNAWQSFGTGR